MASIFKIHPAIGIARVGDADEFFIGPEQIGHPGVEMAADGTETTISQYKSSGRIKRQGARFRVFEYEEAPDGTLQLIGEALGPGVTIEWSVNIVNSKAASNSITPVVAGNRRVLLPNGPPRNPDITDRESLTIRGGNRVLTGASQGPVSFDSGTFLGVRINLGEALTDPMGRLIVLGGRGVSQGVPMVQGGAIPPLNNFANNNRWHDDVSDGAVTAKVTVAGQPAVDAIPAWVICAPPDFAPAAGAPATLFDIVMQAGIARGWINPPQMPSYSKDILPVLRRSRSLQWVEDWPHWNAISEDWAALSRIDNHAGRLAGYRQITETSLNEYELPDYLLTAITSWRDGNFVDDYSSPLSPVSLSRALDEAALEACVGTSFYPGIEAGYLLANSNLYMEPFRLSHQQVKPGQITAQMAVPWQADFNDCSDDWWPSQRPTDVFSNAANVPNSPVRWEDGVSSSGTAANRKKMVDNFAKLGFIVLGPGGMLLEAERDPDLPPR